MGRNDAAIAMMEKVNKKHGPGAIMTASEMVVPRRYQSGSLVLDVSLNGGFAGNQWTEIYGPENNGKTAVTLKTLAHNQRVDPEFHTLWVASEHYDLDQATALGVDTSRVQVLSTQDMAVAYQISLEYLEERATDMLVIDSYPALIPPEEDEKDMDEFTRAEGAKLTNKFFRKAGKAGLRNPDDPGDRPWMGIFINQPRQTMTQTRGPQGMKPGETTPGGMGKNYAFYTRLVVKRAEWLEVGKYPKATKVGQVIRTTALKHKGGPPQRVATMDFYFTDAEREGVRYDRGDYDLPKDIATASILMGVVSKGGTWLKFGEEKWQGLPNFLAALREDEGLQSRVADATRLAVDDPHDKRSWDETDVESASTATKTIRRRRKKEDSAED